MVFILTFALYLFLTAAIVTLTGASHMLRHYAVKRTALGFVVAMSGAQALNDPGHTYPLDHWGMYATADPPEWYYEYVAQGPDGPARLPVALIAPTEPRTVLMRLDRRLFACRCNRNDVILDADFQAIAAASARRRQAPITAIDVYKVSAGRSPSRAKAYSWPATRSQ